MLLAVTFNTRGNRTDQQVSLWVDWNFPHSRANHPSHGGSYLWCRGCTTEKEQSPPRNQTGPLKWWWRSQFLCSALQNQNWDKDLKTTSLKPDFLLSSKNSASFVSLLYQISKFCRSPGEQTWCSKVLQLFCPTWPCWLSKVLSVLINDHLNVWMRLAHWDSGAGWDFNPKL